LEALSMLLLLTISRFVCSLSCLLVAAAGGGERRRSCEQRIDQSSTQLPDAPAAGAVVSTGHAITKDDPMHRPSTILTATALALAGPALTGCTDDQPPGSPDQRAVTTTLERYYRALASGDAKTVCRLLDDDLERRLLADPIHGGDSDCETMVATETLLTTPAEREAYVATEIPEPAVTGDRATVEADAVLVPTQSDRDHAAGDAQITLRRRAGGWLIVGTA